MPLYLVGGAAVFIGSGVMAMAGLGAAFLIPLVAALAIAVLAVPLTGGTARRETGPAAAPAVG